MKKLIIAAALLGAVPTVLIAAPRAPLPPQASIPFVNHGGIDDYEVVDRNTIYVQDRRRQWYRADLFGPCLSLDVNFALRVGFTGGPTDKFDRFSYVQVGRERCAVDSVTLSGPPPKRDRHKRG